MGQSYGGLIPHCCGGTWRRRGKSWGLRRLYPLRELLEYPLERSLNIYWYRKWQTGDAVALPNLEGPLLTGGFSSFDITMCWLVEKHMLQIK